jgi:hypothetical protein
MVISNTATVSDNGGNRAYVLKHKGMFFPTGYKVLSGFERGSLIKCAKYSYDGEIKLLYFSSAYEPLSSMLPTLNENSFMLILINIFNAIFNVRSNGFLTCGNIDISPDSMFVESKTLSVHLIYLPVNYHEGGSSSFENELRATFIKIINETPTLNTAGMRHVAAELSNATTDFQQLSGFLRNARNQISGGPSQTGSLAPGSASHEVSAFITAINAPIDTVFTIDKAEFLIGKTPGAVDGLINYSKAVSRIHCKILCRDGRYYVVDLDSSNGTYINGKQLAANTQFQLENGHTLKIADSEFYVTI